MKWFHFIVSFLRDAPSFFRTTGAGKWLRAFGDPSHQASFFGAAVNLSLMCFAAGAPPRTAAT